VKIAVDTQIIIAKFEQENDKDVISHALTMLLNILHVFIRIIKVLAKMQAAKKKVR
jgi:FtsH-binding integral membrane protein